MPVQEATHSPVEEDAATRAKRLIQLVCVRAKEESMQRIVSQALLYWLRQDTPIQDARKSA
jgi:hypothetical protein